MLGARVVTAAGVVREVSGHDLATIADAEGTTGIITEVTIAVRRATEQEQTAVAFADAQHMAEALGEIKPRDWWRILLREAAMGIVLGTMIAAIAMLRVLMYPDQTLLFAITVGVTVLFIILAGCTVGSMLPIVLKRVGVDPATSSTPFIASLVDTLGVIIYAHVAMVVMRDVIQAHLANPP